MNMQRSVWTFSTLFRHTRYARSDIVKHEPQPPRQHKSRSLCFPNELHFRFRLSDAIIVSLPNVRTTCARHRVIREQQQLQYTSVHIYVLATSTMQITEYFSRYLGYMCVCGIVCDVHASMRSVTPRLWLVIAAAAAAAAQLVLCVLLACNSGSQTKTHSAIVVAEWRQFSQNRKITDGHISSCGRVHMTTNIMCIGHKSASTLCNGAHANGLVAIVCEMRLARSRTASHTHRQYHAQSRIAKCTRVEYTKKHNYICSRFSFISVDAKFLEFNLASDECQTYCVIFNDYVIGPYRRPQPFDLDSNRIVTGWIIGAKNQRPTPDD